MTHGESIRFRCLELANNTVPGDAKDRSEEVVEMAKLFETFVKGS